MSPHKIAFIQNVNSFDHRMVHTLGLADELSNRGYLVDIIIQKDNDQWNEKLWKYNLITISGETYSIKGQLRFMINLYRLLKKLDYDIIHTKNPFSSIIPCLLRKKEAKLIYDIRGLWVDFAEHSGFITQRLSHLLNYIDVRCMNRADSVVAISNPLREVLIKRGVNKEKILVITGDGVKNEIPPKKDVRKLMNINGFIIGYAGSISKARNSQRIIEVFSKVKEKMDDVHLVFIGPIQEESYFRDEILRLELENHVHFSGFLPSHEDVMSYIQSFDVAIAYHNITKPCFNVMVPTKLLEYMAAGVPIIASSHLSHSNILEHMENGYIVDPEPEEFAEGIIELLSDEELRKRLKTNALREVKKYSFKKITDEVESLYMTL
jgi:glycosyltransferase involved in cell wall biosynthesis